MGPKTVLVGQLGRAARSREDEPIEAGEVESKRPSLGCNGVHVTWWGPLIARSSSDLFFFPIFFWLLPQVHSSWLNTN
jgi:hypothetical protein